MDHLKGQEMLSLILYIPFPTSKFSPFALPEKKQGEEFNSTRKCAAGFCVPDLLLTATESHRNMIRKLILKLFKKK